MVICRSETSPPPPATVTHCENSEVLFRGSVAVAVMTLPAGTATGKVALIEATQLLLVGTVVAPMKL